MIFDIVVDHEIGRMPLNCFAFGFLGMRVTKVHLVYADDLIIITGSHSSFIDDFVKLLNSDFSLKDLGDLHYFLGIEVVRSKREIYLERGQMSGAKIDFIPC